MRLVFSLILGSLFTTSVPGAAIARDDFILFLKICDDSPKVVRRNCSGVESLPVENDQIRLYAFLELTWLSPDQAERSTSPLYLRWEFVPEGDKPVLLTNPNTHETYTWRPRPWNNVTHWDVNQRAYQNRQGIYRFIVFDDLSDWEGSIIEEAPVVQVRSDVN